MVKIGFIGNDKVFEKWASKTYLFKINKIKKDKKFNYYKFDDIKKSDMNDEIMKNDILIFGWNMTYISKFYTFKHKFYKKKINDLESSDVIKHHLEPLLKHKKKYLVLQDSHNLDYDGGILNLIEYLNNHYFYGIITPYFFAEGIQLIKRYRFNLKYPLIHKLKFIHLPHHIDERIFKNYHLDKKYDVFLFGNTSKNHYPFRNRLKLLLEEMNENKEIKLLHWKIGVGKNYFKYNEKISNKNLSTAINQSQLTICTKLKHNFLVGKYFETSLSNSVICGDMTKDGKKIWKNNYIHIDDDMTNKEIKEIILDALKDKERLKKIKMYNKEKMKEFYLSKFSNHLFNLIYNK